MPAQSRRPSHSPAEQARRIRKASTFFGTLSDLAIAEEMDVTVASVRKARRAAGIAPAKLTPEETSRRLEAVWSAIGVLSDRAVAKKAGVSLKTVHRARQKAGIAPCRPFKLDKEEIARLFHEGADDEAIARAVQGSPRVVAKLRTEMGLYRKRCLPPF